MVITGHNIVPHHHHSGIGHSLPDCGQHDACEHSADHGDHAGECDVPATHCHAFNGLEYILNSQKQFDKESIASSVSACFISIIFTEEPLPREVYYSPARGAPPIFEGFMGESAGLRAPPHIS